MLEEEDEEEEVPRAAVLADTLDLRQSESAAQGDNALEARITA